jgi:hypothetical protein
VRNNKTRREEELPVQQKAEQGRAGKSGQKYADSVCIIPWTIKSSNGKKQR